ncbi:MAG TPA: NHL repeat-containing protein [Solirubrobacteraceae bacterium]|jgi:hypothetical protein
MSTKRVKRILPLAAIAVTTVLLAGLSSAQAAPVKLIHTGQFGLGAASSLPGGFDEPEGVAAAPNGNIYIADRQNHRMQELTSTGAFVLMFGKEVNETTGGDLCTETEIKASSVKCKAGVEGSAPGQFGEVPSSVAIDPSGDVYVAERIGHGVGERVQKFTAEGKFLLEIGREVNEKTKGNLCTVQEVNESTGVKCAGPVESIVGSTEHGAFNLAGQEGNVLAVGGPEDLVYVGDEHRVQEFETDGAWKDEIPLTSISSAPEERVQALAVDKATGDVYLDYADNGVNNVVREVSPAGTDLKELEVAPREANHPVAISSMALDSEGHLAVAAIEIEGGSERSGLPLGSLYSGASGSLITEFSIPNGTILKGLGFSGENKLYGAGGSGFSGGVVAGQAVQVYAPVPVAELVAAPTSCKAEADQETNATFECVLEGEVNPYDVASTDVWFQWGRTPGLGSETPKQPFPQVEVLEPARATLSGLRPNEQFFYQLAGEDENVRSPEQLVSGRLSLNTPAVPPRPVGEPSASFVTSASAVLSGEINPENAPSEYFFEYGSPQALSSCGGVRKPAGCAGVGSTAVLESSVYGRISVILEVSGLQAASTYAYRLAATGEGGESTPGAQGTFATAPASEPTAETRPASTVTATSALASGFVNSAGQSATYAFELGVYAGAGTQYGVVFSGPAGAEEIALEEAFAVSGLQPGTTYAYRVAVSDGYVRSASHTVYGSPVLFTTAGLPSVLLSPPSLALLAVPNIAFPTSATPLTTKTPAKKAKKRKTSRKKSKKHSGKRSSAHKRKP